MIINRYLWQIYLFYTTVNLLFTSQKNIYHYFPHLQTLLYRQQHLHNTTLNSKKHFLINYLNKHRPSSSRQLNRKDRKRTSLFWHDIHQGTQHQQATKWTHEIWKRRNFQLDLSAKTLRNYQRRVQKRQSFRWRKIAGEASVSKFKNMYILLIF